MIVEYVYNPVLFGQAIFDVILDAKFALILRFQTLELFALPSLCPPVPNDAARNIILDPMSSYPWPWRVDNVSTTTRLQLSKKNSDTYDSVGILVRFGSLFPWVSKFCQISKKKQLFLLTTSNSRIVNQPFASV
jgi:hypothetical protein